MLHLGYFCLGCICGAVASYLYVVVNVYLQER